MCFWPLEQFGDDLLALLRGQARSRTRLSKVVQRVRAAVLPESKPPAGALAADAQSAGDLGLAMALCEQVSRLGPLS